MRIARIASGLAVAVAATLGAAGCGEKPQDAALKSGKYLGKPDTRPWESELQAYGGSAFRQGDQASWEAALKARVQAQNEYARIR